MSGVRSALLTQAPRGIRGRADRPAADFLNPRMVAAGWRQLPVIRDQGKVSVTKPWRFDFTHEIASQQFAGELTVSLTDQLDTEKRAVTDIILRRGVLLGSISPRTLGEFGKRRIDVRPLFARVARDLFRGEKPDKLTYEAPLGFTWESSLPSLTNHQVEDPAGDLINWVNHAVDLMDTLLSMSRREISRMLMRYHRELS